jgi:hypothetical protein
VSKAGLIQEMDAVLSRKTEEQIAEERRERKIRIWEAFGMTREEATAEVERCELDYLNGLLPNSTVAQKKQFLKGE